MNKERIRTAFLFCAGILGAISLACIPVAAQQTAPNKTATQVYVAHLHPMNGNEAKQETRGVARFIIRGDKLIIRMRVHGAPPNITHWQHIHGFKDGHDASCPTQAADKNHDGWIDLIETEPASGTTMVPLDEDPAAMQVADGKYPKASADGTYEYREVVSLKALDDAVGKAFPGQKLDLNHRVVMIHGVPDSTQLPSSVASLGPIPAHVTIPIACGKIEQVTRRHMPTER